MRTLQNAHHPGNDTFDDVHWIGHEERANRCAYEDEQFGRLNEHCDVALFHQEAADDRSKDHENAYDGEHDCPSGADVIWFPPAWKLENAAALALSSRSAKFPVCSAWAAPMLTVSEMRSPHQRKSAVRAKPARTW